jgi:carbamoyl-phosphate synthase large subunit
LFHIYDAFKLGISFRTIHDLTKIDKWFLNQIEDLIHVEKEIEQYDLDTFPKELMEMAKKKGYADRQIAYLLGCLESEVFDKRYKEMGIRRVYKLVDTCAAEFEAKTPYYYSTFGEENEAQTPSFNHHQCPDRRCDPAPLWYPGRKRHLDYRLELRLSRLYLELSKR